MRWASRGSISLPGWLLTELPHGIFAVQERSATTCCGLMGLLPLADHDGVTNSRPVSGPCWRTCKQNERQLANEEQMKTGWERWSCANKQAFTNGACQSGCMQARIVSVTHIKSDPQQHAAHPRSSAIRSGLYCLVSLHAGGRLPSRASAAAAAAGRGAPPAAGARGFHRGHSRVEGGSEHPLAIT